MIDGQKVRAILARGQTAHEHHPEFPDADSACVRNRRRLDLPYLCFNPSCFAGPGGLHLVYRRGRVGSDLFIGDLDAEAGKVTNRRLLEINHAHALAARADPRCFTYGGKLAVAVSGVRLVGEDSYVHQLVAELGPDLRTVAEVWEPRFTFRQDWEKNWQFFEHNGDLFAVYRIVPHVVVWIEDRRVRPYSEHEWYPDWVGGYMRGGASPVRVGDEYFCFFHGRLDHDGWPYVTYSMGCYTFEAQPPFAPVRYTPRPIAIPDGDDWPREMGVSVCYPGGAVRLPDRWLVVYGVHDSFCGLCEVDPELLEREMVPA